MTQMLAVGTENRNARRVLEAQWSKERFICVGLDPDVDRISMDDCVGPDGVISSSLAERLAVYHRLVIRTTAPYAAAYKPNFAFYLAHGIAGLQALQKTVDAVRELAPDALLILDAKWADIDNTNRGYVDYAFGELGVDALTLNPYLGSQALSPFFEYSDKMFFVLAKTSNKGSDEFQNIKLPSKQYLYERVALHAAKKWSNDGNVGLVVGATYPDELQRVRSIVGSTPILIPGIGAQGGDLEKAVISGMNHRRNGFLVNSSRGILFPPRVDGVPLEKAIGHAVLELHMGIRRARNPEPELGQGFKI